MLGGAFDRSMCVGSRAFNLITHLLQCTPRPILPTWRNERYVHVSGKEQQMLFFSDRPGIGSRPASCFPLAFLFLLRPTGDGPRCWILQPFSSCSVLTGTSVPCVPCTLVLRTFLSIHAHHVNCNCVLSPYVNCNSRVTEGNFPRAIIISFGTVFSTDR